MKAPYPNYEDILRNLIVLSQRQSHLGLLEVPSVATMLELRDNKIIELERLCQLATEERRSGLS